MRLIRPVAITPAVLAYSNVAEVPAWSNVTAYLIGDAVYKVVGDLHQGWTAKTNHTGHDPELDDGTHWTATGPTNRYRMLDRAVQSQTENAESIEVTLVLPATRWIDSLAVLNVDAASLRIRVTPAGETEPVFDATLGLVSSSGIDNWWDYFTEPIDRIADKVVVGLPPYVGATIEVTLAAPGGTARCGALVIGFAKRLGDTRWGGRLGIVDYSKKQKNDFGDLEVYERAYAKRRDFSILVRNTFVDQLDTLLARYRATAALWVASPRFGSTIVYGFYNGFEIVFEHPPDHSECRLELESLT